MSGYGPPGHGGYDAEAEIERQLQEEFRRRQALQAGATSAAFSALAAGRPHPGDAYGHLGMLDAGSPYGARGPPSHHGVGGPSGPYGRVPGDPYAGLVGGPPPPRYVADPPGSSLSDLYASHQHQKQAAAMQGLASTYGTGYASGAGTPASSYAAAYGIPPPPQSAGSASLGGYPTSAAPPPPPPPPSVQPPSVEPSYAAGSSKSAQDIARMQEAFQRERENAMKRRQGYSTPARSPTNARDGKSSPSKIKSSSTPRSASVSGTPKSLGGATTGTNSSGASVGGSVGGGGGTAGGDASDISPASSSPKKKEVAVLAKDKDGKTIVEDRGSTWYMGAVPLGVDDDKYWLSELQVFLRSSFAEAFAATEEDIAAPMHGRNKPIALGQVGIRCMHCKHDNPAERGQQATSYPSLISGIYNSVQQMLRLHLDCCLSMPPDVRAKIEQLKLSCSSRGGRKQYWIDSAKRLGLVDTPHGIHFVRDPHGPLPPLSGPSVNSKEHRKRKVPKVKKQPTPAKPPAEEEAAATAAEAEEVPPVDIPKEPEPAPPPVDARPLVFPADKPLISDYLYLTLEQMAPCTLMEADRVGCYKTRKVGFPGLACRHCVGQAGCGRYFPASEASLSQTTTSQTIMNHVRNCRRCPIDIRENLEIMKRNRMGPDGKRQDKPKHGGRKVFFHRLWCRIQGIPFDEGKCETKESKRKRKRSGKRKKRSQSQGGDSDADGSDAEDDEEDLDDEQDDDNMSSDQETATEDEGSKEEESIDSEGEGGEGKSKKKSSPGKKGSHQWVEGCVRLTKTDDPHWLSEMECFARSDLVEVFSYAQKEDLDGYGGRKEPEIGQVGIRCVFCKSLDPSERPNGCINFPDALSTIHTKVADMIRLHFPQCPSMPEDARQTFKSLRGFDAKVASDDSQQYWVDSARDIGLANIPPAGPRAATSWGITFRRNPLEPSPADELDLEAAGEHTPTYGKNSLVRPDDRGLCTDQVMLLLRQVKPCRFKKSDRRAGPGSRGRDRVMGFPGLSCCHCSGRNTLGRYFPVSAKNLTDSTANSLQAHVASCSRAPESIKASLAYLGHRSILQKAELSGSWKKSFFQKVWSRLHVEREWTSADDDAADEEQGETLSGGEEEQVEAEAELPDEESTKEEVETPSAAAAPAAAATASAASGEAASDGEEKEEMGDQMNALIKAAAIWLTEQDAATESTKATSKGSKASRAPTGKRQGNSASPSKGGRASTGLPTKRRRVHF